jgi:nanoRNase/pAp phosphatase (c-di-AMP/oligoRNAs hydrolase)/predicted transcriptional regulator
VCPAATAPIDHLVVAKLGHESNLLAQQQQQETRARIEGRAMKDVLPGLAIVVAALMIRSHVDAFVPTRASSNWMDHRKRPTTRTYVKKSSPHGSTTPPSGRGDTKKPRIGRNDAKQSAKVEQISVDKAVLELPINPKSLSSPEVVAAVVVVDTVILDKNNKKDGHSVKGTKKNAASAPVSNDADLVTRMKYPLVKETPKSESLGVKSDSVNAASMEQQPQRNNGFTNPTAPTTTNNGVIRTSSSSSTSIANRPRFAQQHSSILEDHPARVFPATGFNVVLTHCTADFDSLASAVGLAKLWSIEQQQQHQQKGPPADDGDDDQPGAAAKKPKAFDAPSHVPTFVILPRGAHPGVQRFLGLHKHLFPIRSLKSLLQSDCISALHRLALVDAQRRDRLGPAEPLLAHADRITVVDHHMDQDSDIPATDFVVEPVGSVSTIISERIQAIGRPVLSNAEATLLALGIHADTGSLCFDSTTPRDAAALAWLLSQGASQAAIAEHAQSSLSAEQQGVLMQALVNTNTTVVQGVTVSTVLLQSDGFISGLAAVTEDALDLSSSDVFLFGLVYQAKPGSSRRNGKERQQMTAQKLGERKKNTSLLYAEAWQGGEVALRRRRLSQAFQRNDIDGSGFLEKSEVAAALAGAGVLLQAGTVQEVMNLIDGDGDGKIDFEEFVKFATKAEDVQNQKNNEKGTTMILIGRVRAGINVKSVKLSTIMERFGGGGHSKAASATVRLNDETEAEGILQDIVNEIINTSLKDQPLVRDFVSSHHHWRRLARSNFFFFSRSSSQMTSPVLMAREDMTEMQMDDLFSRFNVRAFPVVDKKNNVIGIVSFQLVADAKQRLKNKIDRSIRMKTEAPKGSAVKGWMLQHVQTVEEDKTMAEVESILLEHDVGCIPVVGVGTKTLIGMVTRTDVLRQHRYYAIP